MAVEKDLIVNLSQAHLVDHTALEKLQQLQRDIDHAGRKMELIGLDEHRPLSSHPTATRKKNKRPIEDHGSSEPAKESEMPV